MAITSFGSELRRLRETKHLTQRSLATQVGIDATYISKIERGRVDHLPSVKTVQRLAHALGVDELELLGRAQRLPAGFEAMTSHPDAREFLRRVSESRPSAADWRRLTATLEQR